MKSPTQQESYHRVDAAVANIRMPSSVLAFRGIVTCVAQGFTCSPPPMLTGVSLSSALPGLSLTLHC